MNVRLMNTDQDTILDGNYLGSIVNIKSFRESVSAKKNWFEERREAGRHAPVLVK